MEAVITRVALGTLVRVMPDPITAPTPSAVRLHGPSVLRRRLSGASESAMSRSMLFV